MYSLRLSIIYCTFLILISTFTVANPITKIPPKEGHTPSTPPNPNHAPLTRRASTSLLGPLKSEDVGDGWLATYNPLEALVPRQQAAAGLIQFYEALQEDFTTLMNANHEPNWLVEASNEGGIGIAMASDHGDPVEWSVALSFCNWIVSLFL